jgi:hypothetical protein
MALAAEASPVAEPEQGVGSVERHVASALPTERVEDGKSNGSRPCINTL